MFGTLSRRLKLFQAVSNQEDLEVIQWSHLQLKHFQLTCHSANTNQNIAEEQFQTNGRIDLSSLWDTWKLLPAWTSKYHYRPETHWWRTPAHPGVLSGLKEMDHLVGTLSELSHNYLLAKPWDHHLHPLRSVFMAMKVETTTQTNTGGDVGRNPLYITHSPGLMGEENNRMMRSP